MGNILSGLVLVNGTDIWTEYGVFLVEDRRGGMENKHSDWQLQSNPGERSNCSTTNTDLQRKNRMSI